MNRPAHRRPPVGELAPGFLLPPQGFFATDGQRSVLRRRAADRAMCRRLGPLPAIIASVRDDSAVYRGHLALLEHTAPNVAAALIVWYRRSTAGQS